MRASHRPLVSLGETNEVKEIATPLMRTVSNHI